MQVHPIDYSVGPRADPVLDDVDASPGHEGDPIVIDARAGAGQRLDRFLASVLAGVSRTRVQRWISLGAVELDGAPALSSRRVRGNESIRAWPQPTEAEHAFEADEVPLSVVYEDEHLMVIDKPAGLVVHPAPGHWRGTLMNGVLFARPDSAKLPRAGIVHRLDKDTSGLMMIARSERAFETLTTELAARRIGRRYVAVVEGVPPATLTIDAPIGRDPRDRLRMAVVSPERGRPAVTHVDRLSADERNAALVCRLETGRTHQIRVHLASRGHPLVGDVLYGGRPREGFARQALHAWRLDLVHPVLGTPMRFDSRLPADLLGLFDTLGLPVPVPAQPEAPRG
jgi:23S rRNA pseudouridine1911/1915/1917 synthase